jgi:hypothetical protein
MRKLAGSSIGGEGGLGGREGKAEKLKTEMLKVESRKLA